MWGFYYTLFTDHWNRDIIQVGGESKMTTYLRLKNMCRTVWSLLTEEERDYYLENAGMIKFIKDVSALLNLQPEYLLIELYDEILEQL
jgi:hypothetical protein